MVEWKQVQNWEFASIEVLRTYIFLLHINFICVSLFIGFIHYNAGQCKPESWSGYNGKSCGDCSALVKVEDYGGSCSKYCSAQGLSCLDGWDDVVPETCSLSAEKQGCDHVWQETSDAICQCTSTGMIFNY